MNELVRDIATMIVNAFTRNQKLPISKLGRHGHLNATGRIITVHIDAMSSLPELGAEQFERAVAVTTETLRQGLEHPEGSLKRSLCPDEWRRLDPDDAHEIAKKIVDAVLKELR